MVDTKAIFMMGSLGKWFFPGILNPDTSDITKPEHA